MLTGNEKASIINDLRLDWIVETYSRGEVAADRSTALETIRSDRRFAAASEYSPPRSVISVRRVFHMLGTADFSSSPGVGVRLPLCPFQLKNAVNLGS